MITSAVRGTDAPCAPWRIRSAVASTEKNGRMDERDDESLFVALREMWEAADPVPPSLADRMVAAVAVDDLSRDFALLDLLDAPERVSVRATTDANVLHFGGDDGNVLVRVTPHDGVCRLDGWSDPPVLAARLAQQGREWEADVSDAGQFSFDDVARGRSHLRMAVRGADRIREVATPWFEV